MVAARRRERLLSRRIRRPSRASGTYSRQAVKSRHSSSTVIPRGGSLLILLPPGRLSRPIRLLRLPDRPPVVAYGGGERSTGG
jgi:hypothetical protein